MWWLVYDYLDRCDDEQSSLEKKFLHIFKKSGSPSPIPASIGSRRRVHARSETHQGVPHPDCQVSAKYTVGIAGDKHQMEPWIGGPQHPGDLRAGQIPHLHIQKYQIQFSDVVFQPFEEPFAGEKLSLRPLTFQNPLQLGPKHQLGIIDVVSDADAQYPLPFLSKPNFPEGPFGCPARTDTGAILSRFPHGSKSNLTSNLLFMTLQRHGPQLGIPFAKNDGSVCYSRRTAVCWDQQVVLLRLLSRPLDAHRLWCGI